MQYKNCAINKLFFQHDFFFMLHIRKGHPNGCPFPAIIYEEVVYNLANSMASLRLLMGKSVG